MHLSSVSYKRLLAVVFAAALLVVPLGACSRKEGAPQDGGTTDQMWSERVQDAELGIVVFDGLPILVPSGESIDYHFGNLEEGHFYRVVADVDYLYGGVAGYDGYPDVKSVSALEEVSPDELAIPGLDERSYGVVRLDGYAGADYLLSEYGRMAVLAGNEWIWRYDRYRVREDKSYVCYNDGVTDEAIEEGIAQGIVGCEEYFLVPSRPDDGR
jgi:hypothetical protein